MQAQPARQGLSDDEFRHALRGVVTRSGRSMRNLSLVMGRDPGYVAALLDPTRPSRARPTPDHLIALSDGTGIPLIELLETLWAIPVQRLADDLTRVALDPVRGAGPTSPSPEDARTIADLTAFLTARRGSGRGSAERTGTG